MQPFYQKYGVQTTDPSKGLMEGLAANKTNLKSVVDGIESMMKMQGNMITQQNTQQATDLLKQKIQERGLGILANPLDQEQELRGFGNMVDKTAIGKTITEQTDLLKNQFTNQASAEADAIFRETGDPIAARNHYNKTLIAAGAPSTFADESSVVYDTRKAADIKNQDILRQRTWDTGFADLIDTARQSGFAASKDKIPQIVAAQPKYQQAATDKFLNDSLKEKAKPREQAMLLIKNDMDAYDKQTDAGYETLNKNLHDQNTQTYNRSDSSSTSIGREGGNRGGGEKSGGYAGLPLIDTKTGTVNPTVAAVLGKNVNNFIESLSKNSDSAKLHALQKDIFDQVGDMDVAGNMLGQLYNSVYKGDKPLGNDLSAKDLETMKTKAKELITTHNGKDTGTSSNSSSSSRSSNRGGNISFTNSDKVMLWLDNRTKERQLRYAAAYNAAQDDELGFKGNTDPNNPVAPTRLQQTLTSFRDRQDPVTTPAVTTVLNAPTTGKIAGGGNKSNSGYDKKSPVGRPGANARIDTFLANNVGTPVKETDDEALARIMAAKNAKVPKQPNQGTAPQATTATSTTSTLTQQQRYEQDKANNEALRKLHAAQIAENKKPKPKVDPRAGKIRVITSEGKVVNVPANTDLQKFKYRLYSK